MKPVAFASMAFLIASRAFADSWIDYELLLKQNAEKVVTSTNGRGELVRSIDFGDGTSVNCTGPVGQASCFGTDMTLSVGCTFLMADGFSKIAHTCAGFASSDELERLEKLREMLGIYVAENPVPKISWDGLQRRLEALVDPVSVELCEEYGGQDYVGVMRELSDPSLLEAMKQALRKPRLPFINPCL